MAMPDTNAFKVLRAQKPHTDEELELRDAEDCDISEMDEEMSSESNFFNKS